MRRREKRTYFQKLDNKAIKWTRGRSCIKLPGRIVITPTNFTNVSYLNLDDFSYHHYYRNLDTQNIPSVIAEEYFQYKYLRNRDSGKCKDFSDLESKHLKEARSFMMYEYDLHVLEKLKAAWDPKILRRYLEYYRSSQKFDFQRSSLVYSTFTCVLLKNSTDSELIVDFFKTVCTHVIACEAIFLGPIAYLELFLLHAQKVGFDPWSLMRKFQLQKDTPVMEFCPVEWSLIQGKYEHMKLLLNYGCSFAVSNYSAKLFNRKIDGRWWNRNRTIPIVMPKDAELSTRKEPFPEDIPFRTSATFLAHFAVVLYLTLNNAMLLGGPDGYRFIECIKLFLRAVPYPYVSEEDMLQIITRLAPSIGEMTTKSCDLYKAAFPVESQDGRKPRSLMHLSRCAVRRYCQLPNSIEDLPLPVYLKSYLNLDW